MVISLKNSFHKVRKVFLVLLPQVIVYKLKVSIFKDFKLNIVVDVAYRRNVDSLSPLLLAFVNVVINISYRPKVNSLPLLFLTFVDLLAEVCYAV
jgi:hypothetical protein